MVLQVGDPLRDFAYVEWQKHLGMAHWNLTKLHEGSLRRAVQTGLGSSKRPQERLEPELASLLKRM